MSDGSGPPQTDPTLTAIDLSREEGVIVPSAAEPSNSAAIGVRGSREAGIVAGGYLSKDLGEGRSLEAQGGYSQKRGGFFSVLFRKVWPSR